jgi:DNA-binding IclR family transcriptional regulator
MPGGKVILSHLPTEQVSELIGQDDLPAATEKTITDRDFLYTELEHIAERGYAINREEYVNGLNALSVIIKLSDNNILGALAVIGPSHRMDNEEYEDQISDSLLEAANELELNVTYSRL